MTRLHRELAVIKALGVTNASLYASVAAQAIFISLSGMVFATALALLLIPLTASLLPQVTLSLTPEAVARTAVASVVVALIASYIPARQVAAVDPLSAFQA